MDRISSKYIIIDIRTGKQIGRMYESFLDAVAMAKSASLSHPEMLLKIKEVPT